MTSLIMVVVVVMHCLLSNVLNCYFSVFVAVVFDLLYEKLFPKLTATEAATKPMNPAEKNDKQCENGFSEQILPNGYDSENCEGDGEGWITVVNNKKQGTVT